jgi:hypothetical protein
VSPRPLRALFAAAAGFPAGYLLAGGLQLPVLAYDPVARRAFFATSVSGVQMRYYGDLLWAAAAAALCACASLIFSRALSRARPFTAGVAAATALALAALDVAYYLSRLFAS